MQILAGIDSIVNRFNRNMDIEKLFEHAQLDNIILSVIPEYALDFPADNTRELTEYIIKDILQNGGEART